MHHDEQSHQPDIGDRREIAHRVEGELAVHARVDRKRAVEAHHEGVAVRGRARDEFRADVAVGSGPVVHQHLLAEGVRQLLSEDAREHVGGSSRGKGHDHAHRPRGPALREGGCGEYE